MSIVINLEPKVLAALEKKASSKGVPLNDYVEDLVSKELALEELLAPVRQQFEESGMTEEDLDEFFEDVRQKAFLERYPNGRHG